jgi:DHA1 family multidrug resistance protein-like MFS transporter
LLQVAIYAGSTAGPLLGGVLSDALGYREVFWITGVLLGLAGVLVRLLVHEEFTPKVRSAEDASGGVRKDFGQVLRDPAIVAVLSSRVLRQLGIRTVMPMLPLFVQELLGSEARVASYTGLVVGLHSVSSTVGSVFLGRVGDRIGHKRILVACAFSGAVFYLPQFFTQDVVQLLALQMAAGLAMGGLTTSGSALLAEASPEGQEGLVYGIDSSAWAGSGALGPLIGAVLVGYWGVRSTFPVSALFFLLGGFLVAWLLGRPAPVASTGQPAGHPSDEVDHSR